MEFKSFVTFKVFYGLYEHRTVVDRKQISKYAFGSCDN